MSYCIKDERRTHFYITDNIVCDINEPILKDIKPLGMAVYGMALSKSNNLNYMFSQRAIAKYLGVCHKTVKRTFEVLEEYGMIDILDKGRGKKKTIVLKDRTNWLWYQGEVRATGPHYTDDKVGRQALTTNTSEGDRPALVRANKTRTNNTNNNIINNNKKTKYFENSGKESQKRNTVNFKLKHFTPETQREILRCLSGFEVSDKIKNITNDVFKSNLKEFAAGNDTKLINC